jgi:hypothetical protein
MQAMIGINDNLCLWNTNTSHQAGYIRGNIHISMFKDHGRGKQAVK